MKSKYLIIGFCISLMIGTIWIVGAALQTDQEGINFDVEQEMAIPSLPAESGVFSMSEHADWLAKMPESTKALQAYYANRAYPGAPPTIPHRLLSAKEIGGKTCLQCHEKGGYVSEFDAYTPITPHPKWLNCKQCHVPKNTQNLFQGSDWQKYGMPDLHQVAMEGAPPIIPHALQYRENCLSCHGGTAAPKEIRVTHPERVNCRQCHLPKSTDKIFDRPVFERPINQEGNPTSQQLKEEKVSEIQNFISKIR